MQVHEAPPNYHAIDEAVAEHHGVRAGVIFLGIVLFAVIHAIRWVAHYSPMVGQ